MTHISEKNFHPTEQPLSAAEKRKSRAHQAIIDGAITAAWAGFIFIPVIDGLFVTGVQLKMINEVCSEYDVRFSKYLGKALIAALVCGLVATIYEQINLKTTPTAILTAAGNLGLSMLNAAITYAVGQVFLRHLESGGSLLDFNTEESKEYLAEMYEEGKNVVNLARARKMKLTA